ncbi:tannase/feruloyl esterase family alpha/beta hydrolase [Aurantiacibacter suaedae]|uniref:tannase/feruloyl esterase family alpha/beta hydrolase n=1 Tax=Aurantiacibacter suaedae TaxID=2545755 RepID=UPI001F4F9D4F|nr:tannase/feruloyl esterase family alpha/beta hydrolase [Aurantiacibacter suaedae]
MMHTKTMLALASATFAFAAPAQAACGDLVGLDLGAGEVTAATEVAKGAFTPPNNGMGPPPGVAASPFADVPAFCRVEMTLTPSSDSDIKSEVWLPLSGWNGKYVGIGNGIWAGSISYAEMGRALARGYATAATDTGHVGSGMDARWAIGHPEKLVDFGYRAVHVTTEAAKRIVAANYGDRPSKSYWNSCSTGGRQGLMAAYRYPQDFDAISAMAPANPMTDLMTQTMWQGFQPVRFGVKLTPDVLGLVHSEILRACDGIDGVTDGIVSSPLQCRPDLAKLQCRAGQEGACLSTGQYHAVSNMFGGTRANDGSLLLPGWPYGSEMQMALLVMGEEPFPVAMSYFRDLVYAGKSDWDWKSTDYRTYTADGFAYGNDLLNVPTDGLGAYFQRGGKLLLSHGWSDGLIPATNTLAFHYGLFNALPAAQRDSQLRLFMAPGMDHCSGGAGPSEIDTLGIIDEWATTGAAPNRILADRPTVAPTFPGQPPQPPREPMQRPLCAWPWVAKYDGTGDPNVAASFSCALP